MIHLNEPGRRRFYLDDVWLWSSVFVLVVLFLGAGLLGVKTLRVIAIEITPHGVHPVLSQDFKPKGE